MTVYINFAPPKIGSVFLINPPSYFFDDLSHREILVCVCNTQESGQEMAAI